MRRFFGIIAALAWLGVAPPALAGGGSHHPVGIDWVIVSSEPGSNLVEPGLERTADGVLHLVYVETGENGAQALKHRAMTGEETIYPGVPGQATEIVSTSAAQNQRLNPSADLIATPDGGLRAFFAGLFPGNSLDQVMSTSVAPASGAGWSNPTAASATSPRSPVYAAAGIGAALGLDGVPTSTWGDDSPAGGGYHVGVSPAVADLPFTPACCEIDPNAAVDAESGETFVAANLVDAGITVANLDTGVSRSVPESVAAWRGQRTSITGRIGEPGVWIGYGTGTNMFEARPAIWEVGADKFLRFKNQVGAEHTGIAPAPDGRIWMYWARNGKICATRSDPSVSEFGSLVCFPPLDAGTVWRLTGEGSGGYLDIAALTDFAAGGETHQVLSVERVAPTLTLVADANKVKQGKALGFTVFDAGDPVAGAEVFSGKLGKDVTNSKGRAKLKIPGKAKLGEHTAYADADGYLLEGYKGRQAKFKVVKD